MVKKERLIYFVAVSLFLILIASSIASAGFFDWFKKTITGKLTEKAVVLNITLGAVAPNVTSVYNDSITAFAPNEAPAATSITINFTAYDGAGIANLNDSSASVSLTKTGEDTRTNASCEWLADFGNYANYTCNVTIWWWDASGTWIVNASIGDVNAVYNANDTTTFTVNARTAFVAAPPILTWAAITAGAVNQTSNTDPVLLNNTGNQNISFGGIQINATDLVGEQDNSKALYAGNFSVGNTTTAGTPPAECSPTDSNTTRKSIYTPLSKPNLPRGNLTKAYSNETSGQEQLYFCLKLAGTELISQPYSTYLQGSWTIQIS